MVEQDKRFCTEIQKKRRPKEYHARRAHEEEVTTVQQYGKKRRVDYNERSECRWARQRDTDHNHRQVTNHGHRWIEKNYKKIGNVIGQIFVYPRRCKTSLVGQSAGLSIPRSSVRFRQKNLKTEKLKSTCI